MGQTEASSWADLGLLDPMYAIATTANKRNRGWDDNEFFAVGEQIVASRLDRVESLGLALTFGSALDFGCGIGRLSRALATRFSEVLAIDVSPTMAEQARRNNPGVEVYVESSPAMTGITGRKFDFIMAQHVLQHVGSKAEILSYVSALAGHLATNGVIAFNVPTSLAFKRRLQPRRRIYAAGRALGLSPEWLYRRGLTPIRMAAVDRSAVEQALRRAGCSLVHADRIDYRNGIVGHYFYAKR